ncbi:MAG: Asp23/Gls24 family envelope stress response protein [Clostridiales bacterium]|nr:Asp23/Gls24 family envelope stress response protein [Clostridiales bacterium]
MSNIKLTANNKQSGKTVYTSAIVQNIVEIAVTEVEGAMPLQDKKKGVSLYILGDNIYVSVSVAAKLGYSVPELAYHIQKSVKQSVENMTRYKIAEVDVHVADVVPCDAPASSVKEQERIDEAEEKN